MMVGLIKADSGHILCRDQDITRLPIHKRSRLGIGYLPQEASVFRKLTVEENILAILQTRNDLNRTDRRDHLEQLLNELSITHIRKSMGISLSGGERRRVEIARTLSMEPDFILLDEPFAGVDPISVSDIQSIITHLTRKRILVSSLLIIMYVKLWAFAAGLILWMTVVSLPKEPRMLYWLMNKYVKST